MLRSMNKLSLRQTINHVVYEMKEQTDEYGPNEDFSWKDIVQKCMEVRQDRLLANIPDLTITDSQPSICFDGNLFSEMETGRDATHEEFSEQNLILDCPSVIKSPRKNSVDRSTTLIEKVPDSPCSSASSSSYSLPHASPLNSPSRSILSQSPTASPIMESTSPLNSPSRSILSQSQIASPIVKSTSLNSSRSILAQSPTASPIMRSTSPLNSLSRSVGSQFSHHSPVLSPFAPVHSSSSQQFSKFNVEPGSRPKRKLAGRRLQTWRGEHPIYKPLENGCFTIDGFTVPRPPDTHKRKKGKAKASKPMLKKIDLSESLIQNSDMTREKMKNNLKPLQNLNWKKSKTTNQIEHAVITRDKENGLVVGMFRFFGKCEKPAQKTSNYTTNYTLLKGLVSIKIGDEPYMIINELESISIPGLTSYSMKNLVDSESILQFHVVSSAL